MRDAIAELVRVQLGLQRVDPLDRIVEDLGAESADLVNIISAVEEKYGIVIEEKDIAGIRSVADLHAALEKQLGGNSPRAGDPT